MGFLIKNEKIEFHNKSYLDFKDFEENTFIYLDPPYQNTSGYNVEFNFEKLNDFLSTYKCYVSEYNLEHKDYKIIFEKLKRNIGGVTTDENIEDLKDNFKKNLDELANLNKNVNDEIDIDIEEILNDFTKKLIEYQVS